MTRDDVQNMNMRWVDLPLVVAHKAYAVNNAAWTGGNFNALEAPTVVSLLDYYTMPLET